MFAGIESAEKDPTKSLHIGDVATPGAGARRGVRRGDGVEHQLQHGVDVDLRAAADVRLPRPLRPGDRRGRARHALPYHVVGSDASGVVLRVGSAVRNWKPGDRVTIHCNSVDDQDPSAHDDSMLAANQRIWGFETNFGGLADLTLVKANQLMPKPTHLTWEEAAVNALCNSTSYRMLVGQPRGAHEAGRHRARLGRHRRHRRLRRAVRAQRRRHADRRRVVAGQGRAAARARLSRRSSTARPRATGSGPTPHTQDESEWRRFGKKCRELIGDDPDIVFEHPGRQTMGASIFACQARRHGRHVRGDVGLHGRVRQPPLLDEAEAADRQPLRQLRRGLRRQPAHRPGPHPAAAVGRAPADRGRRRRPVDPPQRARGQDRRAVPRARARASASTTPRSATASARTRSPCSAATAADPCRVLAASRALSAGGRRTERSHGCQRDPPASTARIRRCC